MSKTSSDCLTYVQFTSCVLGDVGAIWDIFYFVQFSKEATSVFNIGWNFVNYWWKMVVDKSSRDTFFVQF